MRYNKIIYIRYLPLTDKIVQDFYMHQIVEIGIAVEYWDISKLFFNFNDSLIENTGQIRDVLIRKFESYKMLEKELAANTAKDTLWIPIMTVEGRTYKLFKLFSKFNCKIGIFGRNTFPVSFENRNLIDILKTLTLSKIKNKINFYKLKALFSSSKFDGFSVIFQGGKYGINGIGYVPPNIRNETIVKINSDDYDRCLANNTDKLLFSFPYIVFLDEYLPFHPDLDICGLPHIDSRIYYTELNKFFDIVESTYKMPVIIASHPKALKYRNYNYYSNRQVIFEKTNSLVKYCQFVIAHDSTSINYAIYYKKKITFIYSDQLKENLKSTYTNIINFAEQLKSQAINISSNCIYAKNMQGESDIDAYEKWIYAFQTWKSTNNIHTFDIIKEWLRK